MATHPAHHKVYIVEDDAGVRDALSWLLRTRRLLSEPYDSAETFLHELQAGTLQGEVVQTQGSDSALISSPLSQVFAYLNDPANADVFTESARYQRVEQ